MKKITLLLSLVIFMFSAKAGEIEKTFYFSNPQIKNIKGFSQITFGNDLQTAGKGNPVLPYNAVSLLLPPGEEAVSVEIIGENKVDMDGSFILWPYQPSRTLNDTKSSEFYKNESLYNSKSVYPGKLYGNLSTQYMNGYAFALTAFTPVTYIPAEGKVSYFSKVTVKIITKSSEKSQNALKNLSSKKDVLKRVVKLAKNPEVLKEYPEKEYRSEDDYEVMVITTQQYENSFDALKELYLPRGMRVKVVTKEYIQQNMTGQDVQEKIRNYIIQEYQQKGVEFIVLGGDVELIPYRGFYCYVQSGSGYTDYNIPADLYYSALDGNWNTDGDNKWGEQDEDDLLPDIAVARLPFSNQQELNHMLHKTTSYQNNPVMGELRKPLLVGESLYDNPQTWGKDYLELLIGEHNDNGYTTIGIPEDYNIQKMYEADQNWSGQDLKNKINQGLQFVHHVGHANETYVAKWSVGDITNSSFSGANGIDHNYTIMQTHGCDCGAFDYSDCILEKMVTIQNFAVAVVGNSRYGWFNEGQTEGPAAHLHREMVDAMFHEKIAQIGQAFVECKTQTAPWVEAPGQWEEGALRWNFYDLNVMGDAAMSVWCDEPADVEVTYPHEVPGTPYSIGVSVSANGQPAENFRCAIIKDGVLKGLGVTDENGDAVVNFIYPMELGEASLIVSGYNSLPDTNEIMFIPPEGAYVSFVDYELNDSEGNNNGEVDYHENIKLSLTFTNLGIEDAQNVSVKLTSGSPYVTVIDSTESYGNISQGDTVSVNNGFEVLISDTVPDLKPVLLNVEISADGNDEWTSSFKIVAHAPELKFNNFTIDDSNGNNNGILDPGETAEITVSVVNNGSSDAFNVSAELFPQTQWISVTESTMNYGDVSSGNTASAVYEVTADGDAPLGVMCGFDLNITADYNITGFGNFSIVVGQKPVVVIALGANHRSSDSIVAALQKLTVAADLVEEVPDDINMYQCAFVTLGIYSDNHVLTDAEGQKLAAFLDGGGKLYMEGGDTWYYNSPTPVHPYFHINGESDGSDSFETIVGDTSTFMKGFVFEYNGGNNWMDEISPLDDAFTILNNVSSSYNGPAVIAYENETYKTIGSVCEFGGLQPGGELGTGGNQAGYMALMLDFFGINFTWTGVYDNYENNAEVKVYPNPFRNYVHVQIGEELKDNANFIVYDIQGRTVEKMSINTKNFVWNIDSDKLNEGVYFYKIINGNKVTNGKLVYTK